MNYPEIFKSKRQKWLEITVGLAVVVIIIMVLVFSGSSDDTIATPAPTITTADEKDNSSLNYVIAVIVGCGLGYFLLRKRDNSGMPMLPDGEIIEFIADEIYQEQGVYLDTRVYNVRVQRGIPGETYVEFLKESQMYLHFNGVGIIERYPGESIKIVKGAKADDKIQMDLAKIGIAKKRHIDTMEKLGLTEEEL